MKSCLEKKCDSRDGTVRLTAGRRALGAYGEQLAARWYERHGYAVIDRNWRCRDGELDLVIERQGLLVFCEVKTRSSDSYGSPAAAVTRVKQVRIRKLAIRWLEAHEKRSDAIRFDVACVTGGEVVVIEAAF